MILIENISGLDLTIHPQSVLIKVKAQFAQSPKLKKWFNDLLEKKNKSNDDKIVEEKITIDDILTGEEINVKMKIFKRPSCMFQSQGQTKWKGVFRGSWEGLEDKSIGLGSCRFEASWLSSDSSDEETAAELVIHELAHWVEAYSLGKIWPNKPKNIGYDTGDYVIKKFVRW